MADFADTLGFQVLTIGLFGERTRLLYRLLGEAQRLLGLFEATKLRCEALEQNGEADDQADSRYNKDQRLPVPNVDTDDAQLPDRKICDRGKDQADANKERAAARTRASFGPLGRVRRAIATRLVPVHRWLSPCPESSLQQLLGPMNGALG